MYSCGGHWWLCCMHRALLDAPAGSTNMAYMCIYRRTGGLDHSRLVSRSGSSSPGEWSSRECLLTSILVPACPWALQHLLSTPLRCLVVCVLTMYAVCAVCQRSPYLHSSCTPTAVVRIGRAALPKRDWAGIFGTEFGIQVIQERCINCLVHLPLHTGLH